jgi:hypothetical protein
MSETGGENANLPSSPHGDKPFANVGMGAEIDDNSVGIYTRASSSDALRMQVINLLG